MPLVPLGMDVLQFLGACVIVTPVCKKLNVSPILGFLLAGVALRQGNTISDPKELSALAELGVLFLLFEMGLELSSSRLQNLSKYAFGLGTVQVLLTTIVFVLFTLPFGSGLGTLLLERLAGADRVMASIDTWDEAIVVAVSLSLSSSAFVLQILGEKGQLSTRAGSATLGILLLQDLITVPFLVALPILANGNSLEDIVRPILMLQEALPTALKTLLYLGCLVLFGRFGLRRVFEVVAGTKSKDAFVALCILTVCGTAIVTEHLGFGQTLGAFLAGVLLAETSYRNQVEADLKPFKGLLLGLFFLCTGASVNVDLLIHKFPVVALLTAGLLSVKFAITATASSAFGLSRSESIKVGLTLSQGGEFAFVLLELARQLEVLPGELNNLLIIVVVMSMALTPFLAEWGDAWEQQELQDAKLSAGESLTYEMVSAPAEEHRKGVVVLCGFNKASQMVTNMISSPLMGKPVPWIAFEFDPKRVRMARGAGLPVFFGDGSRKEVLHPAGVEEPLAFVLTQKSHVQMLESVERIKSDYPDVPVYALCRDMRCAAEIKARGAFVKVSSAQGGLALGDMLLRGIGTPDADLANLELEMMLAVKEKVRNAALKPQAEDSDLEVFVFDRAQARSFALADEAQRIRNADKLDPSEQPHHDPSQAPSTSGHSPPADAGSDHTSDESESDMDDDWRMISPDSTFEAEILSDSAMRASSAGNSKPKESAGDDDSVLGGLGVMLKSAQDSVKEWKKGMKQNSALGSSQLDSRDGSLDDPDTEWDTEDYNEWKSERENRKAWEKLQLPKVAQAPKRNGSGSEQP